MGLNRCVLRDCPSRKQRSAVSTFKPPNDPFLFAEWQNILEHKCIHYVLSKTSRVCEYHFQPAEIIRGKYKKDEFGNKVFVKSSRPHLETNAIPSIVDFYQYEENADKQDENNKNCQNQQPADEISANTGLLTSSNLESSNPGENNFINDLHTPPVSSEEMTPQTSHAVEILNDKEAATSRSNTPSSFCDVHVLDETSRSDTPLSFYAIDESKENEFISRNSSPTSDCVVDESKENELISQNSIPTNDCVVDESKENELITRNNFPTSGCVVDELKENKVISQVIFPPSHCVVDKPKENEPISQNSSPGHCVVDKPKENEPISQNSSPSHCVVDEPKENEPMSQNNSPLNDCVIDSSNEKESTMIQGDNELSCCVINMSNEKQSSTSKSEMIINVRISVKKDIPSKKPVKQDAPNKKTKISSNLSNTGEDIPVKRARFEENITYNQALEVTEDSNSDESFEKKPLNSRITPVSGNSRKLDMSAFLNSSLKLPDKAWAQTSHDEEVFFSKLTKNKYEKKAFVEKQIVVPKNEDVKVYILDKIITMNSGNPTTLVGLRQLIKKVNDMEVCEGGPQSQENVVYPCAYKDKGNVWRHDNCDIVLKNKKICKFCASLLKKK